ncbi:MAG: ATP-binding cassette domain-containing protein [Tepidisphaera sp.]|nr:ATP-binding cassette domain-containing protein [Tepidisphaera sp.]
MVRVSGLSVSFRRRGRPRRFEALRGVGFEIERGGTLGVVGESGSGKSTLARAMLRLTPATGSAEIDGLDWLAAGAGALRRARRHAQMVFQDPAGSLNPRMRVIDAVMEPAVFHRVCDGAEAARTHVTRTLESCGVPAELHQRFPHELSGGQRQRVAIARAIAPRPKLLVCDEPTSALDVSTQAQVLNLLADLRRELGLTILFISHDLAVVEHVCDSVLVMQGGEVVEQGPTEQVLGEPREKYTRLLVQSVPRRA